MDGIWMAKVGVARGNDRPREAQGVLEGVSHFSLPLRCRERMLSHGVAPLLQRTACNSAKRKREWPFFGLFGAFPGRALLHVA